MLCSVLPSVFFVLTLTKGFILLSKEVEGYGWSGKSQIEPSLSTTLPRGSKTSALTSISDGVFRVQNVGLSMVTKSSLTPKLSAVKTPSQDIVITFQQQLESPKSSFHDGSIQSSSLYHWDNYHGYAVLHSHHAYAETVHTTSIRPSKTVLISENLSLQTLNSSVGPNIATRDGECEREGDNSCNTYVTRWVDFYVNVGGWIMLSVVLIGIASLIVTHILAKRRRKEVKELPLMMYKEMTRRGRGQRV